MKKTLLLILGMTSGALAHSGTVTAGDMLDLDTKIAYAKEQAMLQAVTEPMPTSAVPIPAPVVSGDGGEKRHVPADRVYAVYGVGPNLKGQMLYHGIPSPEFSVGSVVDGTTVKSLSLSEAVLVDRRGKEIHVPVHLGDATESSDSVAGEDPNRNQAVRFTTGGAAPAHISPGTYVAGAPTRRLDMGGPVQPVLPQSVAPTAMPVQPTPVTPNAATIAAMSGGPGMGAVPPHPVQAFTPASLSALQH
jgi:hypothetical protein